MLISKHSDIASHFSRSTKDLAEMQRVAEVMGYPCLQSQPRQNTRIGSTTRMLQTNLINRPALMKFFEVHPDACEGFSLTTDQWRASAEFEGTLSRYDTEH